MDNRQYAYNYFLQRGYTPTAAAGIVGNLVQESGVNPVVRPGDSGTAHGIAQWRGDRYTGLQNYAAQNKGSIGDLGTQLGYLDYELRNKYGDTYKRLMASKNVGDATGAFALGYERPKGAETGVASNVDGWGNRLAAASSVAGLPGMAQSYAPGQAAAAPVSPTDTAMNAPQTIEDIIRATQPRTPQSGGLLGLRAAVQQQPEEDQSDKAFQEFHRQQHQAAVQGLLGGI